MYVEVEFSNPDAETQVEAIGPFRTHESAARYADSLGRAAGLTQNNPDVPGYWTGAGEYLDGNGWQQDVTVTLAVRPHIEPKVRPVARSIRNYLRGEN